MSRFLYMAALLATALFFRAPSMAQEQQGNGATPQGANKTVASNQATPEDDKIYTTKEVTQKAAVKSRPSPSYVPTGFGEMTVIIRAVFRADGEVAPIKVYKISPGNLPDYVVKDLTRSCVEAARGIKFKPAIKDGRPVSQYIQIEYHFR
jgi:hypothetical protein